MKKIIEIKPESAIRLIDYGFYGIPKINALWAIYDEDEIWNHYHYNPDNGLKVERDNMDSLKLSDHHGCSFEERDRAWVVDYNSNLLHYLNCADSEEYIKILIDYEKMKCKECPNWCIGAFDEHFCTISGQRKGSNFSCDITERNIFDHGTVYDK